MKILSITYTLDKWDVAVIQYIKQDEQATIEGIKKIWGIRNLSAIENIQTSYLVNYFVEIICKLELFNTNGIFELIEAASPKEIWKYSDISNWSSDYAEAEKLGNEIDYYDRWMYVIMSKLRNSKVIKLSGYEEITKGDDNFYKKVKTYDD